MQRVLDVGVRHADPDKPAGQLRPRIAQPNLITLNILPEPGPLVVLYLVGEASRRRLADPFAGSLGARHDHIGAIQNPGNLPGDDIGVDQVTERRQVDGHMEKVVDRTALGHRYADEINGMAGDQSFDDIADIGLSSRGRLFVVRKKIARQRRSPRHARVGKLLTVAAAQRNVDAGKTFDAEGAIVKPGIVPRIRWNSRSPASPA